MGGYTDYSVYYTETKRFGEYIKRLNSTINTSTNVQLTNIILGTPMEYELQKKICSSEYYYQWQQLFPYHIKTFIDYHKKTDNDININIIIISPDRIFMDDEYKEPLFTTECDEYEFTKIANREYIYTQDRITIKVDIFTCPFPQLETNILNINKMNHLLKTSSFEFELKTYTPNEDDIKFISDFYIQLDEIASNPLSTMIINSYATFKNISTIKYALFPSLLEFADKHKIIATEWIYSVNNYIIEIVNNISSAIKHSYLPICYLDFFESICINAEYEENTEINMFDAICKKYMAKPTSCGVINFPLEIIFKNIKYGCRYY
jgi:hypothetical protein